MMFPGGSPNFVHDIKVENGFMDVDSRSSQCPSVEHNFASPRSNGSTVDSFPPMQFGQSNNHLYLPETSNFSINFASPRSNCSTVDSIPPMQIGQNNNTPYLPEISSFPTNGCSPTHFSGGSMIPINNNNNNNNLMNDFLSQKMSAISLPPQGNLDIKQGFPQTQQFPPQSQPEQLQYVPQTQPEQAHYPQQQNQQQQQEDPQLDAPIQSFSDLISSSIGMAPIDTNELIQGIEEELNRVGISPMQMNNNFANY